MTRVRQFLDVLTSHEDMGTAQEGPRHVRVFSGDTFLFASYDHGRERLMDVSAHSRENLVAYYHEWRNEVKARHGAPHHRRPDAPAREKTTKPDLPSLLDRIRSAARL